MNRKAALSLALVVGAALSSIPLVLAADAKDEIEDFTGKIVIVYLDELMDEPSQVLTEAQLKTIGGRVFLVGVGADTKQEGDWRVGKKVRIAWDKVSGYYLFTPKEYESFLPNPDHAT